MLTVSQIMSYGFCTPGAGWFLGRTLGRAWGCEWLLGRTFVGLIHMPRAGRFCGKSVNGDMLDDMGEEDLQAELGLTKLQARRVKNNFGRQGGIDN